MRQLDRAQALTSCGPPNAEAAPNILLWACPGDAATSLPIAQIDGLYEAVARAAVIGADYALRWPGRGADESSRSK